MSNFLFGFELLWKVWDKLGKFFSFVLFSEVSILSIIIFGWTSFDDSMFISGDLILFFFWFPSFSFLLLLFFMLLLLLSLLISFFSLGFSFISLFSSFGFLEKIFSALLIVFSNFFLSSSNSLVFKTKLLKFFL